MSQSIGMGGERLHALDAVRGSALLLGVVFHASMSFLPGPEPLWLITDVDTGRGAGVLFFVLHIFRMTTFFLLAGFFGRLLFHRRGAGGFVRDRAKRIALPLVMFWPLAIAGILGAAVCGAWVATGAPPKAPPPALPAPALAFPLTHLWFLYVLLVFYAATLALRGLVAAADRSGALRRGIDRLVGAGLRSPLAPLILALPLTLAFCLTPEWRMWFGIPAPDNSLIPNPTAVAAYGTAFGFGWLLHRQPELLGVWRRRGLAHLAAAIGLTVACLTLAGVAPSTETAAPEPRTYAFAAAYAAASWCWTAAFVGLALRFLAKESPVRRYIADASYWLYIIHLPIVMALQAAVSQWPLPWPLKLAGILAAAFAVMFASYHLMVRYSWLGAILNGRRHARPAKVTFNPEPAR